MEDVKLSLEKHLLRESGLVITPEDMAAFVEVILGAFAALPEKYSKVIPEAELEEIITQYVVGIFEGK